MILDTTQDVQGKLVQEVNGGYVIEILRNEPHKGLRKGQRLTLQTSALVEFTSN